MPRRLGTLLLGTNKNLLESMCNERNLNDFEKEIIIRIYHKRQNLTFIADTMEFDKYGKERKYYSVRTINNIHKEAFKKLMR